MQKNKKDTAFLLKLHELHSLWNTASFKRFYKIFITLPPNLHEQKKTV